MKLPVVALAFVIVAMTATAAPVAGKLPPLRDPVFLNIGFVCQWQERCIERQRKAMKGALSYVSRHRPPAWKVQQCNRNASRRAGRVERERVDWIGFYNCIRNPALRRTSVVARRRR